MKHLKRFYFENISADKIVLDASQSHHLSHTLRLPVRAQVELFNNYHESYIAEITSITPNGLVELRVLSKQTINSTCPVPDITLACAVAKGNRMDWLIEKVAEMGLTGFIPLITARTIVRPSGLGKIERWRKLAIAAAQQSGQHSILDIRPPTLFNALANIIGDYALKLIALPDADNLLPELLESSRPGGRTDSSSSAVQSWTHCPVRGKGKILYLIGPEGDFTPDEAAQAIKWGVQPVRLPVNAILRVETAAVAMLAMLLYEEMR